VAEVPCLPEHSDSISEVKTEVEQYLHEAITAGSEEIEKKEEKEKEEDKEEEEEKEMEEKKKDKRRLSPAKRRLSPGTALHERRRDSVKKQAELEDELKRRTAELEDAKRLAQRLAQEKRDYVWRSKEERKETEALLKQCEELRQECAETRREYESEALKLKECREELTAKDLELQKYRNEARTEYCTAPISPANSSAMFSGPTCVPSSPSKVQVFAPGVETRTSQQSPPNSPTDSPKCLVSAFEQPQSRSPQMRQLMCRFTPVLPEQANPASSCSRLPSPPAGLRSSSPPRVGLGWNFQAKLTTQACLSPQAPFTPQSPFRPPAAFSPQAAFKPTFTPQTPFTPQSPFTPQTRFSPQTRVRSSLTSPTVGLWRSTSLRGFDRYSPLVD